MNLQPITLEGRVVRLVPLGVEHAENLSSSCEPELFTYHFPPPDFSPRGFTVLIQFLTQAPGYLPFAIVHLETGRAIGVTSYLDIRPADRGVEVGFTFVAKEYHGTQVNPECKYLLLRHAFDSQQAIRVQLKTDLRNLRSQRAIEKLGAVREGVLRKHIVRPDGYQRDSVMYSVTCDEWPEVRARLEARLGYLP